jgi:cobalt-zinc-cadmium efflux system outer membrane protein
MLFGRAQAGAASEYDVVRMQVEAAASDARLADARMELLNSAGEIGALMGLPGWRPRAIGQLKPTGLDVHSDTLRTQAEQANPAIETTRREEAAAAS